jgi:hypothetical protein
MLHPDFASSKQCARHKVCHSIISPANHQLLGIVKFKLLRFFWKRTHTHEASVSVSSIRITGVQLLHDNNQETKKSTVTVNQKNTARDRYALWKLYISLLLYAKHLFFGIGKLNLFVVEPWYAHTHKKKPMPVPVTWTKITKEKQIPLLKLNCTVRPSHVFSLGAKSSNVLD